MLFRDEIQAGFLRISYKILDDAKDLMILPSYDSVYPAQTKDNGNFDCSKLPHGTH